MKNRIFILLCSLCFSIFAQDYHVYDLIKVNQIPNGNDPGMIRAYQPNTEDGRPTGMIFDDFGNLYIADADKKSLVVTDENFRFIRNQKYYFAHSGVDANIDGLFLDYSRDSICMSLDSGEESFFVNPFQSRNSIKSSIMYEMNSFFYDKEGNIYCIPDPGSDYATFDAKKVKLYKNQEVVALFESGSGVNMKGLTIDEEYNLFDPEGNLLVRDLDRFYNYWKNHSDINAFNKLDITADEIYTYDSTFMGRDNKNNYYWSNYIAVIVTNSRGQLLDLFLPNAPKKSRTRPAVHPNGDVYFLDYDTDWVYLYKVTRQW